MPSFIEPATDVYIPYLDDYHFINFSGELFSQPETDDRSELKHKMLVKDHSLQESPPTVGTYLFHFKIIYSLSIYFYQDGSQVDQ